jgi:hypothetical protein
MSNEVKSTNAASAASTTTSTSARPEDINERTNATSTATTTTSTPATPPLPRLAYTLKETAQILGISYISAYRLVQRGLLKSSDALRTKMIARTEIDRFLNN